MATIHQTVRIKRGHIMPIKEKNTGIEMGFSNRRAANRFLAGFARYYRVPAWLELRGGQPAVSFIHGITKYTIINEIVK